MTTLGMRSELVEMIRATDAIIRAQEAQHGALSVYLESLARTIAATRQQRDASAAYLAGLDREASALALPARES